MAAPGVDEGHTALLKVSSIAGRKRGFSRGDDTRDHNELTDASYASSTLNETYNYDLNGNRTSANNAIDGSSSALTCVTL